MSAKCNCTSCANHRNGQSQLITELQELQPEQFEFTNQFKYRSSSRNNHSFPTEEVAPFEVYSGVHDEMELEPELTEITYEVPTSIFTSAIAANRISARQFGWACVVGGAVRQPIDGVQTLLGISAGASEEDVARMVKRFQETKLKRIGNGRIDTDTWKAMLKSGVIPKPTFKPASWPVHLMGRKIGIIEKTRPYSNQSTGTSGSVEIELGFRVTDMDAVRRAGFIDKDGEDNFRWIQIIEIRRIGVTAADEIFRKIQRSGRIIDPTLAVLPAVDAHPYYWYETLPSGIPSGFHVRNYRDRSAGVGGKSRCYDWIFYDKPNLPFSSAALGKRAYFNFETALVGVQNNRGVTRNVILNTLQWGFDIIAQNTGHSVKFNGLKAGKFGGSESFRQVLAKEIQAGTFPGHCVRGKDINRAARCS